MPFTFYRFPLQYTVTYNAWHSKAEASVEPIPFVVVCLAQDRATG